MVLVAGLLVCLPLACLVAPFFLHAVLDRGGSAEGEAALDRAERLIGGPGRWRAVATNARAQWRAPDFHGDDHEYVVFDLPTSEVDGFEWTVRGFFSRQPDHAGPIEHAHVPGGDGDEPGWFRDRPDDLTVYEAGGVTVGVSRETGRVWVRRIQN